MQTVWCVFRNADFTEGRGPMVIECIFSTERDANNFIYRRPGIMGVVSDNGSWEVRPYPVFESKQEYVARLKADERQKVLAKLSSRERELLGIKD